MTINTQALQALLNIFVINVHLSLKKRFTKVLISLQKSPLFTQRIALKTPARNKDGLFTKDINLFSEVTVSASINSRVSRKIKKTKKNESNVSNSNGTVF